MEYIEVNGKCYEVLEKGDLYGNISHVRSYWDLMAEVIHSGTDSGNNFYFVVRWLDELGGTEMFWEKDFDEVGFHPLKLLGPDLTEEALTTEIYSGEGMKKYIEDGKSYEILEKGNLDGISHLLLTHGVIVDVISGPHGDERGDFYYMVRYSDGLRDYYYEKDFGPNGILPLKLLGPDLTEEEVVEPDFISARVVGVREHDDDYSIVELKVPSYVAVYWFIRKELEFSEEGDLE